MSELSDNEETPQARWLNCWLIVEHETSSMNVLVVNLGGGEKTLAVFSFAEETELFLYHELSGSAKRHPVLKKAV